MSSVEVFEKKQVTASTYLMLAKYSYGENLVQYIHIVI